MLEHFHIQPRLDVSVDKLVMQAPGKDASEIVAGLKHSCAGHGPYHSHQPQEQEQAKP